MTRTPQMRRYGQNGQYARVKINGQLIHLGRFDDPQSEAKYRQLVAQWALGADPPEPASLGGVSVAELLAGYLDHAARYYGPTNRLSYIKRIIRIVRKLFADTPVTDFGPRRLKVVREAFLKQGWVRKKVNEATRDVVAIFGWGVEQEIVPGNVVHTLREVKGLRLGRCAAPESKPVLPVTQEAVDATCAELTDVVASMVRLQLVTACRPNEVCALRPCDIDRSGDIWEYRPPQHKTAIYGHTRTICIGPVGQDILRPYLLRPCEAYCFSPRDSLKQYLDAKHQARKTPASHGNVPIPARTARTLAAVGDRYDVAAYRRAIQRACDRAFPALEAMEGAELRRWRNAHRWNPNQLRHTKATEVRRAFGLEGAQVVLGHRHAAITEVYALADTRMAAEIARKLG